MNCKVIDGLIRYLTRVIPGGVLLSIARFRFTWFNKCKRFAGLIFKCKLEVGFITKNCQLFSGRGISKDGKNGFGFYMFEGANSIILSANVVGGGACIDDTDKMNILFRDGTRLELVNNTKFNCDGDFVLYFGGVFGKKKELEQLRTKEIETIRVWTSKSYVEEDFTPENSKAFMKSLDCLATK